MVDWFMVILFPFLDFIPFNVPRYWLFRDKLRLPFRAIIGLLIFICAANSAVFCYTNWLGPEAAATTTTYIRYGFLLFNTFLSFVLIKDSLSKNLYTLLLMIAYSFFIYGNANFVESRFFAAYSVLHPYLIYNLVRILFLLITYPFFLHFLKHTICKALAIEEKSIWRYMWAVPLFPTLLGMLYCTVDDTFSFASWQFLLSRYLMLGGAFYVSFLLLKILNSSKKQMQLEESLRYADVTVAAQKKQYEALSEHMEETRRARHDMRQHLAVVRSYTEKNDLEGLRSYIHVSQDALPLDTLDLYCRNDVVNAIICCYGDMARQNGIPFEAVVEYPEHTAIADTDAAVLLGNLLENAVEACKLESGGERFIRLHIQQTGSALVMVLDNTFSGTLRQQENAYSSSKRDGPGIGMRSIQAITAKYNGLAEFRTQGNVFSSSIFLNP